MSKKKMEKEEKWVSRAEELQIRVWDVAEKLELSDDERGRLLEMLPDDSDKVFQNSENHGGIENYLKEIWKKGEYFE